MGLGRPVAEAMRGEGVDLGLVVVVMNKVMSFFGVDPSGKAGVSLDPSLPTSRRQDSWA